MSPASEPDSIDTVVALDVEGEARCREDAGRSRRPRISSLKNINITLASGIRRTWKLRYTLDRGDLDPTMTSPVVRTATFERSTATSSATVRMARNHY